MRSPIPARTFPRPPSRLPASLAAASSRDADRARGAIVQHVQRDPWDALVAAHDGQPLQSWAWGEIKARGGWEPIRLASADGAACAQLLIRRHRGLAIGYVPRGPLLSGDGRTDRALIDEIVRSARSRRAAFVRFEVGALEQDPGAGALRAAFEDAGFEPSERTIQPRSSIRLDLAPSTRELFASFSKGHRADVRRAERDGVAVRAGEPAEAPVLERMLLATKERKDFEFHPASYYGRVLQQFGDRARLLIAELDGRPVGASLNVVFGQFGMYLAAGSTTAGLEHRAAHLLQWHAIRWARARGALTWDLWGIADARGRHTLAVGDGSLSDAALAALEAEAARDPLDGVYRFKKGWGGSVVRTLPAFDRVFIAPVYWYWQWRRGEV